MRGKKLGIALAALAIVAAGAGAWTAAGPVRRPRRRTERATDVTSAGAPMEGVVVTVRQSGSTIATSVVSDAKGRYRFPRGRLAAGDYAVSIKAAGFDLDKPAPIRVAASQPTIADLQLVKTKDLAAQLSNTEWYMSWPGADEDKQLARRCTHCHTYERIARSTHTADAVHAGDPADGGLSAAGVSAQGATPACHALGRRAREHGVAAAAGELSRHHQPQLRALEIRAEDPAPAQGAGDPGDLYGVRPAGEDTPAARRDCRFQGHGLVRRLRRPDPG